MALSLFYTTIRAIAAGIKFVPPAPYWPLNALLSLKTHALTFPPPTLSHLRNAILFPTRMPHLDVCINTLNPFDDVGCVLLLLAHTVLHWYSHFCFVKLHGLLQCGVARA
jgi:hypothetical protein